jgi:ATP-dependent HslUV protease ATP-binding subunit HslU
VELQSLTMEDFHRILTEPKSSLVKHTRRCSKPRREAGVHSRIPRRGGSFRLSSKRGYGKHRRAAAAYNHGTRLGRDQLRGSEKKGQQITVDGDYVRRMLTDIVKDQDLSRYIL